MSEGIWYQCSEPGCGWTGPSHEIDLSRTHLLFEDEIGWCPECQHALRSEDRVNARLQTSAISRDRAHAARLTRELEAARERERAVRDEAIGYLAEIAETLADMHYGEECSFEGGDGCLACYAQDRIAEMQDALRSEAQGELASRRIGDTAAP